MEQTLTTYMKFKKVRYAQYYNTKATVLKQEDINKFLIKPIIKTLISISNTLLFLFQFILTRWKHV